jgi:outer membrane biosynthesis protein TonB
MPYAGEAAEQAIRISLQGAEMALRVSGTGAKHIAALIAAAAASSEKTAGRTRLAAMLRSGKELKVFTVSERDLKEFAKEAKRYGVLYCALREKNPLESGVTDIMVRSEDAFKINRIVERLRLATVDSAEIAQEIEEPKAQQPAPERAAREPEPQTKEGRTAKDEPAAQEAHEMENPTAAKTGRSNPSGRSSGSRGTRRRDTESSRRSVRAEIRKLREERGDAMPVWTDIAKESLNAQRRREAELAPKAARERSR